MKRPRDFRAKVSESKKADACLAAVKTPAHQQGASCVICESERSSVSEGSTSNEVDHVGQIVCKHDGPKRC